MEVETLNSEFGRGPHPDKGSCYCCQTGSMVEACEDAWWGSMEELVPILERDDVGQHLPRSDGGQLVDIDDDQQRRIIWRRLPSARINMTSIINASSTTSRSQSRELSALRLNPPLLGSTSGSRWIVLPSRFRADRSGCGERLTVMAKFSICVPTTQESGLV
jgi:hypothetical protein